MVWAVWAAWATRVFQAYSMPVQYHGDGREKGSPCHPHFFVSYGIMRDNLGMGRREAIESIHNKQRWLSNGLKLNFLDKF
jgi:hypothetical protein